MKVRFKVSIFPSNILSPFLKELKRTSQPIIVELEHFGLKGYGEAPAIDYYM
jgi:hypothetical protein